MRRTAQFGALGVIALATLVASGLTGGPTDTLTTAAAPQRSGLLPVAWLPPAPTTTLLPGPVIVVGEPAGEPVPILCPGAPRPDQPCPEVRTRTTLAEVAHSHASTSGTGSGGASGGGWEALRQCESGGNYGTNTGNGYGGAYQFSPDTHRSVGGDGTPADDSPAEQDAAAQRLYDQRGAAPWPVCGQYLG